MILPFSESEYSQYIKNGYVILDLKINRDTISKAKIGFNKLLDAFEFSW